MELPVAPRWPISGAGVRSARDEASVQRKMDRGAIGCRVSISGAWAAARCRAGAEDAGQVMLNTLRADIDYGLAEARTTSDDWVKSGSTRARSAREQPA